MAITVGDALLRLGLDKGSFDRDMKATEKLVKDRMGKMQDSLKATSASFLKVGKSAGIMAGIGAGAIGILVKSAADFDKAMREVNTLVGLSEEQMADMRAEVKALSVEMGIDAVEASKALYQAISAGQEPTEALEFLNVAARTAVGGITSLETATTGLTSIMNAFGLESSEAERVADVLFVSMKGGITTIDELSTSFFQVAPIAATLGVSFEEVAAAATTITKSGTPTKIAFTSLRQAIVALAKPTKEMADLLEILGFESGTAALEALGLQGTFQALSTETGATQEQLIKAIGSIEAMQAVFGITGLQAEEFSRQMEGVQNATGASQAAFEEMAESSSFKMAQTQQSVQALRRELGEAMLPAVIAIMDALTRMLVPVTEWLQKNPELAKWIGIITVGLVGFIAAIAATSLAVGIATGAIAALITVIQALHLRMVANAVVIGAATVALVAYYIAVGVATAAQWLWNIAMTANPIGAIIVAVAALVAVIVLLVKNIKEVSNLFGLLRVSSDELGQAMIRTADGVEIWADNLTAAWRLTGDEAVRAAKGFDQMAQSLRDTGRAGGDAARGLKRMAQSQRDINQLQADSVQQMRELGFGMDNVGASSIKLRRIRVEGERRAQAAIDFSIEKTKELRNAILAEAARVAAFADEVFFARIANAKVAADAEIAEAKRVADVRIAEFQRANDVMGIIRDRQAEALKEPERARARGRLAEALTPEEAAQALLDLGRLRAQIFQAGSRELRRAGGLGELNLPTGAAGLLGGGDPANILDALRGLEGGPLTTSLRFDVKNLLTIFERLADQGKILIGGQPIALGSMAHGGVIPEPSLLVGLRSMRPYAVAGEAGREFVVPEGKGGGFRTANIRFYMDGRMITSVVGVRLVEEIRLRQAVRA